MISKAVRGMGRYVTAGYLGLLVAGACGGQTDAPGGSSETNFQTCTNDEVCPAGQICQDGYCWRSTTDGQMLTNAACAERSISDCESTDCEILYLRPVDVNNACLGAAAPAYCKERNLVCPDSPTLCSVDGDGQTWFGAPCGDGYSLPASNPCEPFIQENGSGGSPAVVLPNCADAGAAIPNKDAAP